MSDFDPESEALGSPTWHVVETPTHCANYVGNAVWHTLGSTSENSTISKFDNNNISPMELYSNADNEKKPNKKDMCFQFFKKGSCRFGNTCAFTHDKVKSKEVALAIDDSAPTSGSLRIKISNGKTLFCNQFMKHGSCLFGDVCKYVHKSKSRPGQENQDDMSIITMTTIGTGTVTAAGTGAENIYMKRKNYSKNGLSFDIIDDNSSRIESQKVSSDALSQTTTGAYSSATNKSEYIHKLCYPYYRTGTCHRGNCKFSHGKYKYDNDNQSHSGSMHTNKSRSNEKMINEKKMQDDTSVLLKERATHPSAVVSDSNVNGSNLSHQRNRRIVKSPRKNKDRMEMEGHDTSVFQAFDGATLDSTSSVSSNPRPKTPKTVCYRYSNRPAMYRGENALPWRCRFGDTCIFTHFNPALGETAMPPNVVAGLAIHDEQPYILSPNQISRSDVDRDLMGNGVAVGMFNPMDLPVEAHMSPISNVNSDPSTSPLGLGENPKSSDADGATSTTADANKSSTTLKSDTPRTSNYISNVVPSEYVPLSVVNTPIRNTNLISDVTPNRDDVGVINYSVESHTTDLIEESQMKISVDGVDSPKNVRNINHMARQSAKKPCLKELSEFKFGYLGHSYTFQIDPDVEKDAINDISDDSDDNQGDGDDPAIEEWYQTPTGAPQIEANEKPTSHANDINDHSSNTDDVAVGTDTNLNDVSVLDMLEDDHELSPHVVRRNSEYDFAL